jgi:ubiquinol-cytochrome c reductase iron-sulfur subunit
MIDISDTRRRFLTTATSFTAAAGVAALTIPFVKSWQPSARAKVAGAPVKVDSSKIEPGRMISIKWRGKPVWILRRTETNLQNLTQPDHQNELRDPFSKINQQPDYAKNEYRSIRPEVFVAVGICTHLGCVPSYIPEGKEDVSHSLYFCPCHGSKFDLAGRVFKNVPAPTNLVIPPHRYLDDGIIEIGTG